ncbi:hypothetical protein HPB50_025983 [Hyalomma asiaticum]|uniref:Uncharacterized protein n=1 Tax=Hyalomma asiaticum TaxID=266040 RepID=A0ACB7SQR1_HYAAI|nr:hypothetical protein HPB50_025983 [Hyalomma asiaticum]
MLLGVFMSAISYYERVSGTGNTEVATTSAESPNSTTRVTGRQASRTGNPRQLSKVSTAAEDLTTSVTGANAEVPI